MPSPEEIDNLPVTDLARLIEPLMQPLSSGFQFYSLAPLADEDLKPYLHEPVECLPPALRVLAQPIRIVLVPYLDSSDGTCRVAYREPPPDRYVRIVQNASTERLFLVLAVQSEPVPEYHHTFFRALARSVASAHPPELLRQYRELLEVELEASVHGEVDETSWLLKQELPAKRAGRKYEEYVLASLEDTLSLYLHGICCDIDVERGPRQIASRHLRRRLECLFRFYPPPEGRAVFPEQLRS